MQTPRVHDWLVLTWSDVQVAWKTVKFDSIENIGRKIGKLVKIWTKAILLGNRMYTYRVEFTILHKLLDDCYLFIHH